LISADKTCNNIVFFLYRSLLQLYDKWTWVSVLLLATHSGTYTQLISRKIKIFKIIGPFRGKVKKKKWGKAYFADFQEN
jgi:hypothetical protein